MLHNPLRRFVRITRMKELFKLSGQSSKKRRKDISLSQYSKGISEKLGGMLIRKVFTEKQ